MSPSPELGGAFAPAGTSLALNRLGYGAIKLTGPMAWGPPNDRQAAVAVVGGAVPPGVKHHHSHDYYRPPIPHQIIPGALPPHPASLTIRPQGGARRRPGQTL